MASDGPPAPLAWWRSRPWLLVGAGALAGLVVGVLVGTRTDLPGQFEDEPSSRSPVVVGLVSDIFAESASEWEFELPVFNATAAPVDATLVGFDGAALGVTSDTAQNLAGGTWGTIQFSVAANCDALVPGPMSSVRLRVHTGAETSVTALPLPGRGLVLRDYHQAMCASARPGPGARARRRLGRRDGVRIGRLAGREDPPDAVRPRRHVRHRL